MNDSINEWVHRAKAHDTETQPADTGVKVIRKEPERNRGALIMAVADAIRPYLMKLFEGAKDQEGIVAQPAHVRAFALNVAQRMVHAREQDNAAA